MDHNRTYVAIDLKSFYASVECMERGLDPLTTHLVVADDSRTDKTICLAVSPSLKAYGVPGRPRLFEVKQIVNRINREHPEELPLTFLTAKPRMAMYIEYSTQIYQIYLKYIAPEDIHVYSIDEVFLDVTQYLKTYQMTAYELTKTIIKDVYKSVGITATAGIGTNLYLCKVAMDIVAKHVEPDQDGVRIAELDEMSYRKLLWNHTPLTDFWRVGKGYAKKLNAAGIFTMGDVARCSIGKPDELYNEELLYRMFGVNAELLIDHAWGWEPCTIEQVKKYRPESTSMGAGQVLHCPYSFKDARIVAREMMDLLSLELFEKQQMTDQIVLHVGYDIDNLKDTDGKKAYQGALKTDHYGRKVPKPAHGTKTLIDYTSSTRKLVEATMELYDEIVNPNLMIRRISIALNRLMDEKDYVKKENENFEQMDLFTDYSKIEKQREDEAREREKEKKLQKAMLDIKKKYGKNAILKGTNLQKQATARERNEQIGGHKA